MAASMCRLIYAEIQGTDFTANFCTLCHIILDWQTIMAKSLKMVGFYRFKQIKIFSEVYLREIKSPEIQSILENGPSNFYYD